MSDEDIVTPTEYQRGFRAGYNEAMLVRDAVPGNGLPEAIAALEDLIATPYGKSVLAELERGIGVATCNGAWLRARAALRAAASAEPVADTWLVGGPPDLKAMSGDAEDERVIRLHFRRKATEQDRAWLLEAINAKLTHPAPDAEIVAALADARDAFEAIRLVLINHLSEPERSAFWKAVRARDAAAAALAKAKGARS